MDTEIVLVMDHCAIAFIDDVLVWSETSKQHEGCRRCPGHAASVRRSSSPQQVHLWGGRHRVLGPQSKRLRHQPSPGQGGGYHGAQTTEDHLSVRYPVGFCEIYLCNMPMMSQLLTDMKRLMKKGEPSIWDPAQQTAHNSF